MGEYRIRGGHKINGEIRINGGKNAILPILASTVLNRGKSTIHNCPLISDVYTSIELLQAVGCKARMEGTTLFVDSSNADRWEVPDGLVQKMRSSIIFLGGLLGRFGKAVISYPGG